MASIAAPPPRACPPWLWWPPGPPGRGPCGAWVLLVVLATLATRPPVCGGVCGATIAPLASVAVKLGKHGPTTLVFGRASACACAAPLPFTLIGAAAEFLAPLCLANSTAKEVAADPPQCAWLCKNSARAKLGAARGSELRFPWRLRFLGTLRCAATASGGGGGGVQLVDCVLWST